MTYRVMWSNKPSELTDDFLRVPKILYDYRTIHQNVKEEQSILAGSHPLSHYFSHEVVVVYKGTEPVARALIIIYEHDTTAYLGYYESIDDTRASTVLLNEVRVRAKAHARITKIVGPYNASFWLTYRLKLDQFAQPPYMGEPQGKPYYKDQLLASGFKQAYSYVSNEYKIQVSSKEAKVFNEASRRASKLRYVIKSPKPSEFSSVLSNAYELFSSLYADFPGYKAITKEEFLDSFQDLRSVLDYSFVKFGYLNNELAGFAVAFPDYGNLLYRPMTKRNKLRIVSRRFRARRYIIMYLGVLPQHSGLAKALVRPLVISALLRGSRIVGALALEDKVTASYAKSLIGKQYHYGLFEKEL